MRFDFRHPKPLIEVYPALKRRSQYFDDDKFLRFLILLVAPDSPIADERNWETRVATAMELLGLDPESPLAERFYKQDMDVQEQLFQLFVIFGDIVYEQWISMRISFAIMTARLRDPMGLKDTDRLKYMAEVEKASAILLKMEASLFKGDTFLRNLANSQALNLSLSGYAEKYALTLDEEDL